MNLLVYDERVDACSAFSLPPDAQMPFVTGFRFPCSDFAGGAKCETAWTDRRALLALDRLAELAGVPFTVCGAFKRTGPLPRRTGTAFDIGLHLPPAQLSQLRRAALASGAFTRVLPSYVSGDRVTVIFDCAPTVLKPGCRGAAVCALQDALLMEGLFSGPVTGAFDENTRRAVLRHQRLTGLPQTGAVFPSEAPLDALLTV